MFHLRKDEWEIVSIVLSTINPIEKIANRTIVARGNNILQGVASF